MTMTVQVGDVAPDFTLPGDGNSRISLADLAGQKVVLYFYPKDDTAGCTREAIEFNAARQDFAARNCAIVGISADSPQRHDRFKAKHNLEIPLASDESLAVLEAYGVWREKTMYGRKFMGIERSTFLIDSKGIIRRVWRKVKLDGHVAEVLAACSKID